MRTSALFMSADDQDIRAVHLSRDSDSSRDLDAHAECRRLSWESMFTFKPADRRCCSRGHKFQLPTRTERWKPLRPIKTLHEASWLPSFGCSFGVSVTMTTTPRFFASFPVRTSPRGKSQQTVNSQTSLHGKMFIRVDVSWEPRRSSRRHLLSLIVRHYLYIRRYYNLKQVLSCGMLTSNKCCHDFHSLCTMFAMFASPDETYRPRWRHECMDRAFIWDENHRSVGITCDHNLWILKYKTLKQ